MLADPIRDAAARRAGAERARRLGRPVLVSVTRPTTPRQALDLFGASAATDRHLWLRPATGEALVGLGAVDVLTLHGHGRFAQAAQGWRDLLEAAVVDDASGGLAWTGPLLLGGFRFDVQSPPTELWDGFPDGRLLLPRVLYSQRDGQAWLTTNTILAQTNAAATPFRGEGGQGRTPPDWQHLVETVARGIRSGHLGLEKVVLARAERMRARHPFDPAAALRRLAADYPTCTLFAVAHGDRCFLGASPERLVQLRDGIAASMALAGSTARGATDAEDAALAEQLLGSPKERAEHAVVVRALRAGLADVCSRVMADTQPRVRKLPNLQHLLTPVRGQLAAGRTIFDLVERLHPTPAVGGYPRERALELIRATEGLDRGWYAGPIGWVNRAGDGEFVVGIRSALVRGPEATLFAGCGIVADSQPAAEYAESRWKLRPMLAALSSGAQDD